MIIMPEFYKIINNREFSLLLWAELNMNAILKEFNDMKKLEMI